MAVAPALAKGSSCERSAIILIDGVCNLCNGFVTFVIDNDPHGLFQFAQLQSPQARKILRAMGVDDGDRDSIVLIDQGKIYWRSTAVLHITARLKGGWKFTRLLF